MSSNISMSIRSRLLEVLKQRTDEARRFKSLEESTRISGATWRTFWNRNSTPSGEMVEAIARLWPQYAFWLATGGTDPLAGHVAPPGVEGIWENVNEEIPEANEYLQYQMNLLMQDRPTFIDQLNEHEVKRTGFRVLELADEALQQEIASHMPPGTQPFTVKPQNRSADLSELLTQSQSRASNEYQQAREAVMNERREKKLEKLFALRKRKSEIGR